MLAGNQREPRSTQAPRPPEAAISILNQLHPLQAGMAVPADE